MNLEEYNKSDRENGAEKAGYAQSESSERISAASPLPKGDAKAPGLPGSTLAPGNINTKVWVARSTALRAWRDGARAVAAVMFVLVRAIDFTRVTLTRFVPDALSVLAATATGASGAAVARWPIQFMLVSSVGFVALQLYWFSLFVRVSLAQNARQKRKDEKKRST